MSHFHVYDIFVVFEGITCCPWRLHTWWEASFLWCHLLVTILSWKFDKHNAEYAFTWPSTCFFLVKWFCVALANSNYWTLHGGSLRVYWCKSSFSRDAPVLVTCSEWCLDCGPSYTKLDGVEACPGLLCHCSADNSLFSCDVVLKGYAECPVMSVVLRCWIIVGVVQRIPY